MEIRLRTVISASNFFGWLLYPIFWLRSLKTRKKVPAIQDEILTLSATELAKMIRQKEISSEQIVMAYIKRIKQVNPIINAVVEDRFVAALEEAQAVDKELQSNKDLTPAELEMVKPLLGVPITIKESIGVKGLSQCVGSKKRIGIKAEEDGGAVEKVKMAGAIPLLVSNTPEYCLYWETNNLVTGCTRNPYNTNCTSGGSSGGEGALLASGASIVGIGSDVGGSIRLPALFNGVFGHKPTPGVVSTKNHFPNPGDPILESYLGIGPMTRYAEDLLLLMKVLTDHKDLELDKKVDLTDLTIYYMTRAEKSLVMMSVDREIQQCIKDCTYHLKYKCSSNISDYKFSMDNTFEMACSMFYSIDNLPEIVMKSEDNLYLEFIKSTGHMSKYSRNGLVYQFLNDAKGFIPRSKSSKYEIKAAALKEDLKNKLGDSGVLLYPTYPTAAFQHDQFCLKTSGILYMMIFNVFGFPSTHVPLGLNKNGMPIGIQVVAAPFKDRLCFAIAEELERAFGGWVSPEQTI